jgi:hypothetical protein
MSGELIRVYNKQVGKSKPMNYEEAASCKWQNEATKYNVNIQYCFYGEGVDKIFIHDAPHK